VFGPLFVPIPPHPPQEAERHALHVSRLQRAAARRELDAGSETEQAAARGIRQLEVATSTVDGLFRAAIAEAEAEHQATVIGKYFRLGRGVSLGLLSLHVSLLRCLEFKNTQL